MLTLQPHSHSFNDDAAVWKTFSDIYCGKTEPNDRAVSTSEDKDLSWLPSLTFLFQYQLTVLWLEVTLWVFFFFTETKYQVDNVRTEHVRMKMYIFGIYITLSILFPFPTLLHFPVLYYIFYCLLLFYCVVFVSRQYNVSSPSIT